jgi:hypothetical protein
MCAIDLEPCEVWREEERKARKAHRCDSCGGQIAPGSRYLSHFSVFEGEPTTRAMCLPCLADRKEFGDAHGTLPIPSFFPQMLSDCIAEGDEESETKWQPMLERVQARGREAMAP